MLIKSKKILFNFHDEIFKNIRTSYSMQMIDGSYINYYQDQAISMSPEGAGIPASYESHVTGNIMVNAEVGYSQDNAASDNIAGKVFSGITISGHLTQPEIGVEEGLRTEFKGTLSVVYGGTNYYDYLDILTEAYVRETGTLVKGASIFIPASDIDINKSFSKVMMRAGRTNNSNLYAKPLNFLWQLQRDPIFKQWK